jgi:tetratricopeptide (TPR) repeat protein
MKATLNLVDHLLAMGRHYQELGRHRDALSLFTRLSSFRRLPAEAAEEAQARLAELHMKRRRYRRARRHLTAALRHQPSSARYHYLMAASLQADERGSMEQAAEHYRRALELDPQHAKCRADYGLLAIRMGQTDEGLDHLRQAVEQAPDDVEVLGKLVKGLRLTDRGDEARSVIRAALFRHPRQPRFRKLYDEFQFQQARRHADAAHQEGDGDGSDDSPVLLPFVRLAHTAPAEAPLPTILGYDEAPRRPARGGDQRNVQ